MGGYWSVAESFAATVKKSTFRVAAIMLVALRSGMQSQWSAFGTDGQPPRLRRTWEE
jgi:hypothetical protein